MQAVLLAVLVLGYAVFTYLSDRDQAKEAATRQALAVTRSVADSPPSGRRSAPRTPPRASSPTRTASSGTPAWTS